MKKSISVFQSIAFILLLITCQTLQAQENLRALSGKVIDKTSKEALPFATVRVGKTGPGVVSNADGEFKLVIPQAYSDSAVRVGLIGYKPATFAQKELERTKTAALEEDIVTTEEIVVTPKSGRQKPYLDGKWQASFYREYFLKKEDGSKEEIPVEMLECDYWLKRIKPADVSRDVYITNSRAKENFGRVKLSSSYCLSQIWNQANYLLDFVYDSSAKLEDRGRKSIMYNGQKAAVFNYARTRLEGTTTYEVIRIANGDVVQIKTHFIRGPKASDDKRSFWTVFRLFKGSVNYVVNNLENKNLFKYENELPVFAHRVGHFYLKFDGDELTKPAVYNYISLWSRTGEADAEPEKYAYKWKPGTTLFRQAISKGTNFWGLANTILPTEQEEEYLRILSESK